MKKFNCILILLLSIKFLSFGMSDSDTIKLDIQKTIEIACDSSLTAFETQNQYLSSYWGYRSYVASRLPALSLNLTPANYYRVFTKRYDSYLDKDVYREQQEYESYAGLRLQQNVGFTGGSLYVESNLGFMKSFGDEYTKQFSSVPFRIGYTQSLIGYNEFKWDKKIEPLRFMKAKRSLVYNMEQTAEVAIQYFFDLALAQVSYSIAKENLKSRDTLCVIGERKYKIAAIQKADYLTLQLDRINAKNDLENAKISLDKAMSKLAVYLNMSKGTKIDLTLPKRPLSIEMDLEQAIQLAHENNPTYLERKLDVLSNERNVQKTKVQSKFNASLTASIGFNQVAETFPDAYRKPREQDIAEISLSVPILDWGVRKGQYNMAKNDLKVSQIAAEKSATEIEEEVTMTYNDFRIQQMQIETAEQSMNLANAAYHEYMQRFMIGKCDLSSLTIAIQKQQTANREYISVLKNYWICYYKLRRLTLYDFEHNQSLIDNFNFDTGFRK